MADFAPQQWVWVKNTHFVDFHRKPLLSPHINTCRSARKEEYTEKRGCGLVGLHGELRKDPKLGAEEREGVNLEEFSLPSKQQHVQRSCGHRYTLMLFRSTGWAIWVKWLYLLPLDHQPSKRGLLTSKQWTLWTEEADFDFLHVSCGILFTSFNPEA